MRRTNAGGGKVEKVGFKKNSASTNSEVACAQMQVGKKGDML
jgi:hypothetical protein